nr:DMT family transporter [Lentibacter algarum]
MFWLVTLTMAAFAANSVITRLALATGATEPAAFAAIRLFSGALVLGGLASVRSGQVPWKGGSTVGVASLLAYVLGFSFAYVSLDAGAGALLLFGGVQVTMFAAALAGRERISAAKWAGTVLAFAGLCLLMWPSGEGAVTGLSVAMMLLAAVGWGVYSLVGRGAQDAMSATAGNFVLAAPFALLLWALVPSWPTSEGVALACLSGAVTSGLGYALWYRVLPQLSVSTAAVAQLTVPVMAVLGGALLLDEMLSVKLLVSAAMVLGGVALSLYRTKGSRGS